MDNHGNAPRLLRPREAAELLAISPRKLWEMGNCGELPVVRLGRATRFDARDVYAWIRRNKRNRIGRNGQ